MKKVGIIGGLGPLAGAHFYKRLIELSPATSDEQQLPVILVSDPTIPSRVRHLTANGESPVFKLQAVARQLVDMGSALLVIPSSTTSLYHSEVARSVGVPVLSLVEAVAQEVSQSGMTNIGLLGTTPTLTFRLYAEALARLGINIVRPDDSSQQSIMDIIAHVKGNRQHENMDPSEQILEVANRKWSNDIDGLLLACTEIPLIFPRNSWNRNVKLFSSTDILARATVREAYRDSD